jgi:flagellin
VELLLGDGNGSFSSSGTFSSGDGLATQATALSVADLNGDGRDDLVTSNGTSFRILLGQADGTFAAQQTVGVSANIQNVVVGDFNNDGVVDSLGSGNTTAITALGGTRDGIAPILPFSLMTKADALQALAPLERARSALSIQRGVIGGFQSRLDSAVNTLGQTSENYRAAESRIRDADIALESAALVRLQILRDSSAAVLAQANAQPELVLQLLTVSE